MKINKQFVFWTIMLIFAILASYLLIKTYENPFDKVCTEDLSSVEVCPANYNPVCGDNLKTYSNACEACKSSEVDRFLDGECS